jgi:hypothetical protein
MAAWKRNTRLRSETPPPSPHIVPVLGSKVSRTLRPSSDHPSIQWRTLGQIPGGANGLGGEK